MTRDSKTLALPNEVLDFWFSSESKPYWFKASEAFDAALARKFAGLHGMARNRELDIWSATPEGALALVLLLDQVPRNIFRMSPKAFATDKIALAVARAAISKGFDSLLGKDEKMFLYLPFEHAEDMEAQDDAVRLIEALGLAEHTEYARSHRDIIHRFGRFPHRNDCLGRPSTREEIEFLKQPGSSF